MRVGPAANVARINVAETITALWSFAHAQGLLTDDINERTVDTGVTVDGVLLRDASVRLLGIAAETNISFQTQVGAEVQRRIIIEAGGVIEWGDGTAARDTNLFRAAADELETNDSFRVAGVLGLITDLITERSAAVGVTIDGVLLQDSAILLLELAAAATPAFRAAVTGDAQQRYLIEASGRTEWGDGTAVRDTNLFRAAANELATDDDFNVGGALDLAGDVEYSERNATLGAGDNNDVVTGTVTVQRLTPNLAGSTVTGFAGGRAGRRLLVFNVGTAGQITLSHQDAGSVAANRLITPNNADLIVGIADGVNLWYDDTSLRWRAVAYV